MLSTAMKREIGEMPAAATRLLSDGCYAIANGATASCKAEPRLFAAVARSLSNHAATYLEYASET